MKSISSMSIAIDGGGGWRNNPPLTIGLVLFADQDEKIRNASAVKPLRIEGGPGFRRFRFQEPQEAKSRRDQGVHRISEGPMPGHRRFHA